MTNASEKMHVISHTHWDREWYLPFELFRHRLVDVIDNVLGVLDRYPDFRCFHLDAQTVVLEDYLEIRPQNEARLKERIREGRLHVGPWYVQNDEFLTSGESTVRNLLIGTRIAREFGCTDWVGYIPDQFGNLSQLPQIFNEFGIDTALFGRGKAPKPDADVEFFWKAPDGSRVVSVFMLLWYNNAQRLPSAPEKLKKLLGHLRERLGPVTPSGQVLLMNGVDHLDVQENLVDVLKSIDPAWELPPVVHSTLPEFFRQVKEALAEKELDEICGELREGPDPMILNGTLSSRPYLKQANNYCEFLLTRYLEPMAVALDALGIKVYPKDRLRHLWKLLIQNHPHDSICGCSIDPVHRDNMNRLRRVRELGEQLVAESMEALALACKRPDARETDYKVAVFNPSEFERSDIVTARIDLIESEDALDTFDLIGPDGRSIPFRVGRERRINKRYLSPVNLPGAKPVRRMEISFFAENVPAMGVKTYVLRPGAKGEALPPVQMAEKLENECLSVEIQPDGSLIVRDKRSGKEWTGLNYFVDEGDLGDLYTFRAVEGETPISTLDGQAKIRCVEANELRSVYEVMISLDVPKEADTANKKRSEKKAECFIRSRIELRKGEPFVRVSTSIRNRSKNHRLRVHFDVPDGVDHAAADCPFDVVERPSRSPEEWNRKVNVNPMHTFVAASSEGKGLAVFVRGLYAQELTEKPSLAVTLLRCTGRISAADEHCPGEGQETKDSQLLGWNHFDYAICPLTKTWSESDVARLAEAFNLPFRALQVPVDAKRLEGGRPWTSEDQMEYAYRPRPGADANLPPELSFLSVKNPLVRVSAVKLAEDRPAKIVRLYNLSDADQACDVQIGWLATTCWRCRLDEERLEELTLRDGTVSLSIGPKKIVTLEFA